MGQGDKSVETRYAKEIEEFTSRLTERFNEVGAMVNSKSVRQLKREVKAAKEREEIAKQMEEYIKLHS